MPTDDKLLTLMQWLSPSFPISSFAYSHGLETAVADSWVRPDSLRDWLQGILIEGIATDITGRKQAKEHATACERPRSKAPCSRRPSTRSGAAICRT